MYELPSSFCPYEVGVGVGGAQLLLYPIAVRVGVGRVAGAALCQTHVGIISIEQILSLIHISISYIFSNNYPNFFASYLKMLYICKVQL